MSGLFGSLGLGISGLSVSRRGLETVSHNISNADNPAYTRQQAINAESRPVYMGYGFSPRGSETQQIRQIRDEFLDTKLRREYSSEAYWRGREKVLSQIETIMNEKGVIDDEVEGGLGKILDDFWTAWNEVAKEPDNMTVRGVLKERANAFVTTVNHMYKQLDNLQINLNIEVKALVDETNQLTKDIADLNKQIVAAQQGKEVPNDLRDARNQMVDRLSQLLNVSHYEDEKGNVNVALNGINIVLEDSFREFEYKDSTETGANGMVDVFMKGEKDPMKVGKDLNGGELAAILEARGLGDAPLGTNYYKEAIPTMKAHLDELVSTIAYKINSIHSGGHTIDGSKDKYFFISESGSVDVNGVPDKITARNIKLAFTSLDDIAAGATEGYIGDGKIAEEIAKLRDGMLYGSTTKIPAETDPEKRTLTMEQYYRDMILDLGAAGREAINMGEFHSDVIAQCENSRASMSAVSLDEEMTEMLKFQHAYSANSRFINAIDEMLDVIVNKIGA